MRRLVVLLIGALAVGCAAPVPPEPTPAPVTPPPPPPVAARPREIRLDGVDPCTLLSPAQRTSLGLGGAPQPYVSGPPTPGKACSITGFEPRAINVSLTAATAVGIEAITAPGSVSDRLAQIAVAGFPAVLARPSNPDGCFVDVDVAPGQVLDVQFADGGGATPIPQDQLCDGAAVIAGQALSTLMHR